MNRIEVTVVTEVPDETHVGDVVTLTLRGRITAIEEPLIDVSSLSCVEYASGVREYKMLALEATISE